MRAIAGAMPLRRGKRCTAASLHATERYYTGRRAKFARELVPLGARQFHERMRGQGGTHGSGQGLMRCSKTGWQIGPKGNQDQTCASHLLHAGCTDARDNGWRACQRAVARR